MEVIISYNINANNYVWKWVRQNDTEENQAQTAVIPCTHVTPTVLVVIFIFFYGGENARGRWSLKETFLIRFYHI